MRMNRAARHVRAVERPRAGGSARGLWHHLRFVPHHVRDMRMTMPVAEFVHPSVTADAR
jgi:hypothetical protein